MPVKAIPYRLSFIEVDNGLIIATKESVDLRTRTPLETMLSIHSGMDFNQEDILTLMRCNSRSSKLRQTGKTTIHIIATALLTVLEGEAEYTETDSSDPRMCTMRGRNSILNQIHRTLNEIRLLHAIRVVKPYRFYLCSETPEVFEYRKLLSPLMSRDKLRIPWDKIPEQYFKNIFGDLDA